MKSELIVSEVFMPAVLAISVITNNSLKAESVKLLLFRNANEGMF